MAQQRDNTAYSLHWTITDRTRALTTHRAIFISAPALYYHHLSMVSRGREERRGGRGEKGRKGPRISHFPEENDLVMAVKRETEYFSICEVERERERERERWKQSLLLGKILNLESFFYLTLYWQIYYLTLASLFQ